VYESIINKVDSCLAVIKMARLASLILFERYGGFGSQSSNGLDQVASIEGKVVKNCLREAVFGMVPR